MSRASKTKTPGANSKRSITLYPNRRKVEIAPGVRVAPLPPEEVPQIALARLQPVGDGNYKALLVTHDVFVRLSAAAKIVHVPYRLLLRLCKGGFVQSSQPTPGYYKMNLVSYFEHERRIQEDPDFWLNDKNKRRYQCTL